MIDSSICVSASKPLPSQSAVRRSLRWNTPSSSSGNTTMTPNVPIIGEPNAVTRAADEAVIFVVGIGKAS